MSSDRGKLGSFLAEVIHWNWLEFCRAEGDHKYTGYQAAVFSLVRTCSEGKLGAIKAAIDRVDGKLVTPVNVEYPKVWFVFPLAKRVAELPTGEEEPMALPSAETLPAVTEEPEPEKRGPEEAATLTLRQMVNKMADQTSALVPLILKVKRDVEAKFRANEEISDSEMADRKIPLVKSVIAANLLNLAIEKNNFEAITEVFDQIDGKLVETIKVLGGDIFLTNYAEEAPYGSIKNKDGVYMLAAKDAEKSWKAKLKKD